MVNKKLTGQKLDRKLGRKTKLRMIGRRRVQSGETLASLPGSRTCQRTGKATRHVAIHRLIKMG